MLKRSTKFLERLDKPAADLCPTVLVNVGLLVSLWLGCVTSLHIVTSVDVFIVRLTTRSIDLTIQRRRSCDFMEAGRQHSADTWKLTV